MAQLTQLEKAVIFETVELLKSSPFEIYCPLNTTIEYAFAYGVEGVRAIRFYIEDHRKQGTSDEVIFSDILNDIMGTHRKEGDLPSSICYYNIFIKTKREQSLNELSNSKRR